MAIVERQKVLIYATYRERLLVFDEPDFPDVKLQVPGGTVEPGEAVLAAAQREFCEETGLPRPEHMDLLATVLYDFQKSDGLHRHRRSFFHAPLKPPLAEMWEHHEVFPDGGGEPILFRFFWMNITEASNKLGYGMDQLLDRISL